MPAVQKLVAATERKEEKLLVTTFAREEKANVVVSRVCSRTLIPWPDYGSRRADILHVRTAAGKLSTGQKAQRKSLLPRPSARIYAARGERAGLGIFLWNCADFIPRGTMNARLLHAHGAGKRACASCWLPFSPS